MSVALLPLLMVTVLGTAAPPSRHSHPTVLVNSTVSIYRMTASAPRFVANGKRGRIKLRLRPGEYELDSVIFDEGPVANKCESKTIHIRRGDSTRHVDLFCQTK
jgi:hypothetical protein